MFPKINPTKTKAWKKLKAHYLTHHSMNMNELFEADENRFKKFSIEFEDILFDYSKNIVNDKTIELLVDLANECQLTEAISAMFSGEKINETEDRAVLHTALRNFSNEPILVSGENITPLVEQERKRIKALCQEIHTGNWTGFTGEKIKTIVNIGVGGSDLGAAMVTEALQPFWEEDIQALFISNIDGANLLEALEEIDFEETLFIVASKTFTTQETMTNANTIKELFLEECHDESFIENHFIAITGNKEAANTFGIPNENIYEIWDWVCGRFSLWGSMGMSIALTIGYDQFEELLKGANTVDEHFKNEEFDKNIPVIMGLLSVWYINFFNSKSEAVLPYAHHLSKFKAYLQQGAMESNGKSIDRNGLPVEYQTGVVVWGEVGTNGQHSFHQLLHQGTDLIPCDFIIPINSQNSLQDHQDKLLCNAFAQTEALMKGKAHITNEIPFKIFEGNRPTNSILLKELSPHNLGSLLAFYEHKIFVQGVIWNIFSFDQWGVELGKDLSKSKLKAIKKENISNEFDSSTNGLLNSLLKMQSD
jgi:glucose-6-phosphate isomerase